VTIEDTLQGPAGRELAAKLASAFSVDEQKTDAAVRSLAGELSVRIQRAMLSRGGVADVVGLVTAPGAQFALSDPTYLSSDAVKADGNQILNVLIGNKHLSRGIAARTASATGLDPGTVESMLPVVANVLIGELQRQSGPTIARVAANIPGFQGAGGSPLPMPGDVFPPVSYPGNPDTSTQTDPGAPSLPRGPRDMGNPLPIPGDDIPGVGRHSRYQPDSDPGDNPYERLPDIVRRGGQRVPGPEGQGGTLEDIIRSILGNLLGSNSGVIGTMIRLFLVRWIVSLVRRVFSGAIGGR
jgi:hypothetical protein